MRIPTLIRPLSAAAFVLILATEPYAQNLAGFTTQSLNGSYALVGTGGARTAASVGIENYDGKGNVTRSLLLNEAGPDEKRQIIAITGTGTYSVRPNGMGSATITNTLPDGSTFVSDLDFVITHARTRKGEGYKLATEFFSVLRESGIAAPLVTFTLTRLPD